MTYIFIISFMLCLASYSLHTFTHYLEFYKKDVPIFIDKYFHAIVHWGYLAWVVMLFTDPVRFNVPQYIIVVGSIIGTIGLYMMVGSIKSRRTTDKGALITTGIYSRFRHPMYIGMALIMAGFPLAVGSLLTLISSIIWISQMLIWRYWEEIELIARHGHKYRDFTNNTYF